MSVFMYPCTPDGNDAYMHDISTHYACMHDACIQYSCIHDAYTDDAYIKDPGN